MITGFPRAHTLSSLRNLIEIILSHATPYVHRGHRVILFVDKGDEMLILGRLLLLRTIQVIGSCHPVSILALVQASRIAIVQARSVGLAILFGG